MKISIPQNKIKKLTKNYGIYWYNQPKEELEKYLTDNQIEQVEESLKPFVKELFEEKFNSEVKEKGQVLTSSNIVKKYFKEKVTTFEERERLGVILLDSQANILTDKIVAKGGVDVCRVYVRDIIELAVKNKLTTTAIIYHNHPANSETASSADRNLANKVKKALEYLEIDLVDSFILTDNNVVSMAEKGYI